MKWIGVRLFLVVATLSFYGCGNGYSSLTPPITVGAKASAQTIDQSQQVSLTANVTNDPSGVTWGNPICSSSTCGSLTNVTATGATYQPPSTVPLLLTVTVAATSVKDPTQSASATFVVAPNPVVSPAVDSVPATIGSAYSMQLVNGGTPPYKLQFSAPGSTSAGSKSALQRVSFATTSAGTTGTCAGLPSWLAFNPNTGVLSATNGAIPSTATDFVCGVTITDNLNVTAPAVTVSILVPMVITTTALPATEQTQSSYSAPLAALGGPGVYSWSVVGSLPSGLSLNPNTGVISGTVGANASTQKFAIQVAGSASDPPVNQNFGITVDPRVAVTMPSAADLTFNISGSRSLTLQTVAGTGVGPFQWNAVSALPSWLTLSNGGVLSATTVPNNATTSQVILQVTDAFDISSPVTLTVTVPILISTPSLPSAEQTQASYSATLTAQGGTGVYSWTVTLGALPAGLILAQNGTISGTPSVAATTQTFTVQVTDSASASASQQFAVSINPQVAIAAPSQASLMASIGGPFNLSLQTTPGTGVGPFTWTVTSGTLPPWLSLSPGGLLSATQVPTTAITTPFTVQVKDSANVVASLALTLTVPIKIVTPSLPSAEQTQASYNATLTAQGGTGVYSWMVTTGALPSGLTLAQNGTISGTPSVAATTQTFTVQVTDSGNTSTSQQFTVSINPQVAIAAPSGASLLANIGGNFNLPLQTSARTGVAPFTWALANGSAPLPSWLNLSSGGVLSATQVPTTANTAQFTVQVTDSANITASLALTLTVSIKILTTSLSTGEVTSAYSSTLVAQGGSGSFTWSSTGLPGWATINSNTGVISGSPTQGASNVVVKATDSLGATASAPFTLTILAAVTVGTTSLPNGALNTAYSQTLLATGGLSPYSNWQISGNGTLQAGLSLDKNSGIISGTPVCPVSTSSFSVTVQDSLNVTSASQALSITTTTEPVAITTMSIPNYATGVAYSQQLQFSGGSCSVTWSVVSGSLPGWLTLSANGLLGGTPGPSDTASVSFVVQATDGATTATQSLTLGFSAIYTVSGQVSLANGGGPLPGAMISLGSNLSATTDSNGNYSVSTGNGSYTVTPSFAAAPSSAFIPASPNITAANGTFTINVNGGNLTGINFTAALGFTVSGTVTYSGKIVNKTPPVVVFIRLQPTNCNNCSTLGTSVSFFTSFPNAPFSIEGVPPGTYNLEAWLDDSGYGIPNSFDPTGMSGPVTVAVATGNVSNAAITITDATVASIVTTGPNLKASVIQPDALSQFSGVIIQYQPVVQNGVEQALFYNLQWSALANDGSNQTCESSTPDGGFIVNLSTGASNPIIAGGGRTVILDSNNFAGPVPGYFFGTQDQPQTYYICMQAVTEDPTTGTLNFSQWNAVDPPVTIGPPAASGTNNVSGSITIPDAASPSGPLYAGCYDVNTGNIYAASSEVDSLVTASVGQNPYSVSGVPTGASCFIFAMLDQDADGLITPMNPLAAEGENLSTFGDIYNTNAPNPNTVTITGNTTQGVDVDLTSYSNNSSPTLGTQHVMATDISNNIQESYDLNFVVTPLLSLPIRVTLLAGPNVVAPADFAICTTCGEQSEFNISLNTNGVRPLIGDSYVFQIAYSDTPTPPDIVTLTVTGVSDAFATSLSPIGPAPGATPTFSWTDPSSPSSYAYQFLLSDSTGNTIWQIPGLNSFSSFFSSSITSVPWSTTSDPTGANNPPSVATLTSGATYTWSITVRDTNGNSAQTQANFVP